MELGISTFTYGWAFDPGGPEGRPIFDEFDLIKKARELGVCRIQVGDNLPLHDFSAARLGAFRNALRENGIILEIGARGLTAAHLRRYMDICGAMDSRLLRFIVDADGYQPPVAELISLIRGQLDRLEDMRLVLAIENHDRFRARELAAMLDAIHSPWLGICLDTANSLGAGEGIETVVEQLSAHTVNLHVKDFGTSRLRHKQGFRVDGRIAGEGLLDIPFLFERLGAAHRCGSCILEQWVPPEASLEATRAKEQAWAQQSMEYLKRVSAAWAGKRPETQEASISL